MAETASRSVDVHRCLEQVTRQRNAALDQAAQWQAYAEQVVEENQQLREENERLRSSGGGGSLSSETAV